MLTVLHHIELVKRFQQRKKILYFPNLLNLPDPMIFNVANSTYLRGYLFKRVENI